MISGNEILTKSEVSGEIPSKTVLLSKQEIILDTLGKLGPMTRTELMEYTEIKWTTLFDNLEKLVLRKLVHSYPRKSKKGRPATMWALDQ